MNLIGIKVKHKSFGEGTVIECSENCITITFPQGEKKFVYPDIFQTFITVLDSRVNEFIKKEIADADAKKAAEIEVKMQQEKTNINAKEDVQTKFLSSKIGSTIAQDYSIEKGPKGHQHFFVFQNKSFEYEKRGGYLWAPQFTSDSKKVSHWSLMEEVHKGDVIFHSLNKNISAISIAMTNCYAAKRPLEHKNEQMWEEDGWRVDCRYIAIQYPVMTSDYKDEILELQPRKYAPFNYLGRGNTGYLFVSNYSLSKFIFEKLLIKNTYLNQFSGELGLGK